LSHSEARAVERGEEPIKVPRLELIVIDKTGRCSSVYDCCFPVNVTSLDTAECWRISFCGETPLIAPRGRVTDRNEDRRGCPFLVWRASRAARGWAMHFLPARILSFIHSPPFRATWPQRYAALTFGTFDFRRADRPATFEFRP